MTGFSGTSWTEEVRSRNEAANLNQCRDLVEVAGGLDWEIRKLVEKYPDTCWKYATTSTILKYQPENVVVIEEEINGNTSNCYDHRIFHARLIDVDSPFDIYVQPKYLDKARCNMIKSMNEVYCEKSEELQFLEYQMMLNIACAVNFKGEWYRGLIESFTKSGSAYIRLVDFGSMRIVDKSDLRRLISKFGRIPPMVLRCKVRGVLVQNMDVHKVEGFRRDMAELDNFVRCQITTDEEPYLVNLFHPTIFHLNLCEHLYEVNKSFYLPPRPSKPESFDDDSDFSDEDEEAFEDEGKPQLYIRQFPRSQKAMRFFDKKFEVVHVEHANLIYLASSSMREDRIRIEEELASRWSSLPNLPESWIAVGCACAVLEDGTENPKRAVIDFIGKEFIEVILIDYGRYLEIKNEEVDEKTRVVIENEMLCSIPQVVAVSLKNGIPIHYSAIQELRRIIPVGSVVYFEHYQKSKQIPIRGDLKIGVQQSDDLECDLEIILMKKLETSKININCMELVPFSSPSLVSKHSYVTNTNFIYRYDVSKAFTRANFEVCPLPV